MSNRARDAAGLGFFAPADGWIGDLIPVALDGEAWLYYLFDDRAGRTPAERASGMPWRAVTTTDFARFRDRGLALPAGGAEDADFDCYTGSVVRDDDGTLHLFYTGHNPARRTDRGDLQVVCHATSAGDPSRWTKHPEWTFGATEEHAPEDWRDPFVFRPSPDGPWLMALAARRATGPDRRTGEVACLASDDLITWRETEPLWEPHRFITQECPDIFEWNGTWYLVYSEFSDSFQARYRMAESPRGPWVSPPQDTLEGRAFYAPKTVEHAGARYLVGWIATREGESDDGAWQWAGDLSALQLRQREDRTLAVALPDGVLDAYTSAEASRRDVRSALVPQDGAHERPGAGSWTRYSAWIGPTAPTDCLITLNLRIEPGTQGCGLLLSASEDGEKAYVIRMEPPRNRLVLDRWPRRRTGDEQWQISGDVPHAVELERPADLGPGPHELRVRLDGSRCVVSLDDEVTLSARLYGREADRIGFFVVDGEAAIERLEIAEP